MARFFVGQSLSRWTASLRSTGSMPVRFMFSVAHQNPDPTAEFEQVTPLVFIPDFVQSTEAVASCTATLAATAKSSNDHGYSTIFVTSDESQVPLSIDAAVTQLHGILQALPMPPLVLAHGTSAYFVNKYLESYPFSAALFLNPCSPDRASHVKPAATALLKDASNNPIYLEPSPIPILVVRDLGGNGCLHDASWLLEIHDVGVDEVLEVNLHGGSLWQSSEFSDWIYAVA